MNRIPIPRRAGDRAAAGPWWWPVAEPQGKRSASVKCPLCGTVAHLSHQIAASGDVSPSVVCPTEGCSWHVFVTLVGWKGGAPSPPPDAA